MTIDGTVPTDDDMDQQPAADVPAAPAPEAETEPVSTATVAGYALLIAALVGWFLYGALVQRQGLIASAGESLGTAFALMVAVSVVAVARRSRD